MLDSKVREQLDLSVKFYVKFGMQDESEKTSWIIWSRVDR